MVEAYINKNYIYLSVFQEVKVICDSELSEAGYPRI